MDNKSKFIIVNEANEYIDIYLYGTIGNWSDGNKIDGDSIADQIRYYDNNKFHIINEHINSDGGEIINGLSIVAANLGCKNAKIHTYNEGVCASIAGVIHQTGTKKFAVSYSQFMMHEPSMCGETIETTTDPIIKKRLEAAKEQLLSILVSSTGMSEKKLEEMMNQETWLNANECEKMGFVSKGCIIDMPNKAITKNLKPHDILILVNKAFNNLNNNQMTQIKCEKCGEELEFNENKIENENAATCPGCKSKIDDKGKVITGQASPVIDKTEPVVDVATFTKLSDQVTSLTNLVTGLTKENEILKAESAASKKKSTETILDKAIEVGKFVKESREGYLRDYASNPEGLQKIVDSIPMPHNNIAGVIDRSKEDAPIPGGYKKLRELEKENPALAEKFALDNPVAYDKLYKAEYK